MKTLREMIDIVEAGQRGGLSGEPDVVNIPGPAKGTKPSPKAITKGADREYYKAPGLGGTTVTKWRKKTSEDIEEGTFMGRPAKYGVVVVGHNDGKPVKTFDNEADAKAYANKGIRVDGILKQGSVRTMVSEDEIEESEDPIKKIDELFRDKE